MTEFACMEDWDLQAVVRGCINLEAPTATLGNPKSCCPPPMIAVEDGALSFTENSETKTVLDELEMLYKPNFSHVLNPVSSQTILASSISAPKELQEPDQSDQKQSVKSPRRRKSQHKRVVQCVTVAERFRSDMWAWRKYGQKPIKGSAYPRSYYRCSSSNGCSARKQMERSTLDPGVFIVTYTSEHNHSYPTRQSSIAGSTRRSHLITTPREKTKYSPHSSKVLSPTTPLMASIEGEFVQSASLKKEEEQIFVQETDQGNYDHGIFNIDDMVLENELLFPSLEEFEELASEPAPLSGSLSETFLYLGSLIDPHPQMMVTDSEEHIYT